MQPNEYRIEQVTAWFKREIEKHGKGLPELAMAIHSRSPYISVSAWSRGKHYCAAADTIEGAVERLRQQVPQGAEYIAMLRKQAVQLQAEAAEIEAELAGNIKDNDE